MSQTEHLLPANPIARTLRVPPKWLRAEAGAGRVRQMGKSLATHLDVHVNNVIIANAPQTIIIGKAVFPNRNSREREPRLARLIVGGIFQLIVGILQALFIWYLNGR